MKTMIKTNNEKLNKILEDEQLNLKELIFIDEQFNNLILQFQKKGEYMEGVEDIIFTTLTVDLEDYTYEKDVEFDELENSLDYLTDEEILEDLNSTL